MFKKDSIVKALTFCFFIVAFFEIVSEYLAYTPFICSLKPLIPLLLVVIYLTSSTQKNPVFVIVLLLSMVVNILFIPNTPACLYYALIIFTIHRIVIIYLIFSLQKVKDFIPIVIATVPFLLIFFYLFIETNEIPSNSFYLLILQNILISLFAGIALSSYVMNDNKQNSVLLISVLLFVMLQFTVFIEKYFLVNEFQMLFRPLAMTFNTLAFFSFYKYVIIAEKSNHN
ncbi:hypothetical protein HKT18_12065 [Flavobacterium sp. IMCC34852]|uniref:YhhN-like protein n=1 Tax=Flavobacterium rivulicola TaxID=2732161 RepID=A0A7Y3RB98_9FLAO|nr:hypothetical protein [Flavobacterium sp. IMCC34852]NNT72955.1 hypothetical protein [Flavobacterium sp. IMCC34852]